MRAIVYLAVFAVIATVLAVSASFTDRRSVKTWAPNAVFAKPRPVETAAILPPKPDVPTVPPTSEAAKPAPAPEQPASGAEAPAAARPSTTVIDAHATGTLPKQAESAEQATAPKISPAPVHALRERGRAARPARQARGARAPVNTTQARRAAPPSSREPIQFRLAEGRN
jgi:hypothetical protein